MITKALFSFFFFIVFLTPQSFSSIKLTLLIPLLGFVMLHFLSKQKFSINKDVIFYFIFFITIILSYIFLGLVNGNSLVASIEAFRVYVIFMIIYFILMLYLSSTNFEKNINIFFVFVSIGISFVTFITVFDAFFSMGLIGDNLRDEMLLEIGIHEGYTQLNSLNIGVFSFVLPYLISIAILSRKQSFILNVSILLGVLSVIMASRRIIMFLVFLTPFLVLIINYLCNGNNIFKKVYTFYISLFIGSCAFLSFLYLLDPVIILGFKDRLLETIAFDGNSLRSRQHTALMDGLIDSPFFGSGIGGTVDIIRNSERPWIFELTFSQMLYNFGIAGFLAWCLFYIHYSFLVFRKISKSIKNKTIYISLYVGFISVMVASITNPYLGSFDYLFALILLPLIIQSIHVNKSE